MTALTTFWLMMGSAFAVLLTLCLVAYAMHCLLVVMRDTAAGCDEVFWSAEPFQDSLGGAFHLAAVVLIWLALFGVVARALHEVWLPGDPALRFLLLAVPGLWLFLPVALFSSLSASSRWYVFRPIIVWNLLRLAPFTFVVYLFSAILAVLVAALAYIAVIRGWFVVVPVAGVATATAWLIYARLLGRLGWKIGQLSPGKQRPMKKAKAKSRPKANTAVTQRPSAPPIESIEPDETDAEWETTPYGQKRRRTESYGVTQETPSPSDAAPEDGVTHLDAAPAASITKRPPAPESPDFDRSIRMRMRQINRLKRPFLSGVFPFPWYAQTCRPWLLLSLGFLAVYGAGYGIVSLYLTMSKLG